MMMEVQAQIWVTLAWCAFLLLAAWFRWPWLGLVLLVHGSKLLFQFIGSLWQALAGEDIFPGYNQPAMILSLVIFVRSFLLFFFDNKRLNSWLQEGLIINQGKGKLLL